MRISRFYHPASLAGHTSVTLDEGTSHHLLRVLRSPLGAPLLLFDGSGAQYPAKLVAVERKLAVVQLETAHYPQVESCLQTQLVLALSKGDRVDLGVQKAVELGVQSIQPIASERSELRLTGERRDKKQHHWQQIADSACEQSGRVKRVDVLPPLSLADWLASLAARQEGELRLLLHPRAAIPMAQMPRPQWLRLLVGPEGGFSDGEIERATEQGFVSTLIGPRVLRTETAPIVALSLAQSLWGDF